MNNLLVYIINLIIFLVIDFTWLGLIAKSFYQKHLGSLMLKSPNWPAAIIFYLLYIVGVTFFISLPALEKSSLQYAIVAGALFGLVAYATYDLTNLATLKSWPQIVTIVDLIWGTTLTASVSAISYLILQKITA